MFRGNIRVTVVECLGLSDNVPTLPVNYLILLMKPRIDGELSA
jgi:hypothetical protein